MNKSESKYFNTAQKMDKALISLLEEKSFEYITVSVFSTVLLHSFSFGFDEIFQRLYENVFNPVLERFRYPIADRKYAMMFYLNGITAVVTEWLKDDCEKSIGEVSQIIYGCIFGRKNDV